MGMARVHRTARGLTVKNEEHNEGHESQCVDSWRQPASPFDFPVDRDAEWREGELPYWHSVVKGTPQG